MSDVVPINTGHEGSTADQFKAYFSRLRAGEMGAVPAVGAMLLLVALFSALSPFFLTTINIANLFVQTGTILTMTVALVFVIVIGEIDLSAGVTAGTGMAVFVKLNQVLPEYWIWNLAFAFLIGLAVGWFIGFFVAKIGVPSFVISLALYLALPGVMLIILGEGGVLRVEVPEIKAIMNQNLPLGAGWAMLGLCLVITLGMGLWDRGRRIKAQLPVRPLTLLWIKVGASGLLGAGAIALLSVNRSQNAFMPIAGVPLVIPFVLVILFACTFLLDRTKFGRHLFAVGGNPEAARRAGIKVARIRIYAFIICSSLAMLSGVFNISRVGNVESSAGRAIVLQGVAAAVVGGVSLFGGRGRVAHAALGAFVIAMIDNGLGLIGIPAGVNFIVTGGVLAVAATVDALARRRSGTSLTRT
jgi:D-xylose transport system permease protein